MLRKLNENNLLWVPIADAVGTFLRRRAGSCEGYERTWRLIHMWEAIATTLSNISVARLRDVDSAKHIYRKCREHLYGRSWNALSKSFDSYQGALDGSAVRRLLKMKVRMCEEMKDKSYLWFHALSASTTQSNEQKAHGRWLCRLPVGRRRYQEIKAR